MIPTMSMSNVSIYHMQKVAVPAPDTASSGAAGQVDRNPGVARNSQSEPAQRESEGASAAPRFDSYECQTCKNRKYQDGSDDPGVSFKLPTKLSPEKAASAVRSHENEHVSRAKIEAEREDKKIVSQSVTYHTAICPECGRVYVSGGTTRTTFKNDAGEPAGQAGNEEEKDGRVDKLL